LFIGNIFLLFLRFFSIFFVPCCIPPQSIHEVPNCMVVERVFFSHLSFSTFFFTDLFDYSFLFTFSSNISCYSSRA
jgi:hypothetical protein